MEKRQEEGQKMLEDSKALLETLPYWASRAVHLHVPEWKYL